MANDLKPCPFCGNDGGGPIEDALQLFHSEPCDYDDRHTWSVQCDRCTATMGHSNSEDEAIEAWNRRALPALPADLAGPDGGVSIAALQVAHVERQEEWCPDQKPDLSFRGNEMAGEVGEACNVIKKLERERHGWRGSRATKDQLADELADVVHTAILCAITAEIDLAPAVVAKFNATSEKNGLSTTLRPALEALAGRQVAVTDEMVGQACLVFITAMQHQGAYVGGKRPELHNTNLNYVVRKVLEFNFNGTRPEGISYVTETVEAAIAGTFHVMIVQSRKASEVEYDFWRIAPNAKKFAVLVANGETRNNGTPLYAVSGTYNDAEDAGIKAGQILARSAPPAPQAAADAWALVVDGKIVSTTHEPNTAEFMRAENRNAVVQELYFSTPPASGKVEAEAVGCEYCIDGLQADGETPCPCCQDRDYEATVAAMQAEIERLTALLDEARSLHNHQVHRAEAAEAELAKLREGLAEVRHLINTRGSHRAIPFIDAIIEGGDTWPERAEAFEKAAEMSRALLKGETE